MMNEEQLIRDLRAGDREAMRLLYESHKDRLFTLARGLLGDVSTAEDVVHDVFLGFVESLHRYHVNGGLGAYLAASVANRARDRLRSVRRQEAKPACVEGGGVGRQRRRRLLEQPAALTGHLGAVRLERGYGRPISVGGHSLLFLAGQLHVGPTPTWHGRERPCCIGGTPMPRAAATPTCNCPAVSGALLDLFRDF